MRHPFKLLILNFLLLGLISCKEDKYSQPKNTEEALKSFILHEDFEIDVFAAEPYIQDPVDLVFDETGKVYAVEMPDYPYKPEPGKGKGVIRQLIDTNGDGRIDSAHVFAEGLPDATSLMPWKGGLLVTSAPHILYLKDKDGDGKADTQEILFSGFFENNSEAQITNLRLGVDNWIYAANNGQRSEVLSIENPKAQPLNLQGGDFRFRLDTLQYERESGTAQFGQTLDDWGNKYFTQNTIHLQQVIIPGRYLDRHGLLFNKAASQNISNHDFEMFQLTPPPYWRAERTKRRNKQYTDQNLDRVEHADKFFTGASGGTFYDGEAFPENFYGNIFTGDVAGNLVHTDRLIPDKNNPTMVAERPAELEKIEFLASTDPWFRPVGFTVGPDGYLYMVDFYRQHIETPVSIPDDLKEDMDFMKGENLGRIYRIRPKKAKGDKIAQMDFPDDREKKWVNHLGHPNGWWRATAQRLILENSSMDMVPDLIKIAKDHSDPRARVRSLHLLAAKGALNADLIRNALNSDHDGLIKNALVLAEAYPELTEDIKEKTENSSPQVALQAILSLGAFDGQAITAALGKSLMDRGDNKWFKAAILSASAGSNLAMVELLHEKYQFFQSEEEWKMDFLKEISHIIASQGNQEAIKKLISIITGMAGNSANWNLAAMEGIKSGLRQQQSHSPLIASLLEHSTKSEEDAHSWMIQLQGTL